MTIVFFFIYLVASFVCYFWCNFLLQIPVIKDLPVGDNLQDHIAAGGIVFLIKPKIGIVQSRFENVWATMKYAFFGQGNI